MSMKGGRLHASKLRSESGSAETLGRLRGYVKTLGQGGKDTSLDSSWRRPCVRRGLVLEHSRTSQNRLCTSIVQGAEG